MFVAEIEQRCVNISFSTLQHIRKKADREVHLLSTMKTKYYFLAKKSLTVVESITASLNV